MGGLRRVINKGKGLNGFRNGKNIELVFKKLANNKNIDKISSIKMPIVIPTVDIMDSKEYIFTNYIPEKSSIAKQKYITDITIGEAVRASSSFPAIFNLCTIRHHTFMDGGALNNIPVEEVRKQGADKVIAVKFDEDKIDDNSNLMDIVMKTIDIMGSKIAEQNLEKSDLIININTGKMGLLDTDNMQKCYWCGYKAVQDNIEDIKKLVYSKE